MPRPAQQPQELSPSPPPGTPRDPVPSGQGTMEPFPLYDLGLLTESKVLRRILCPMAAQLCPLILALAREDGAGRASPRLGENAERLAQATEELAAVARRLAEESSDEELKKEAGPAAESLVLAGRRVLLVAHELQEQPQDRGHREELAAAAQSVFTETVKVLQLAEAAGARRISGTASWLRERLGVLRAGDTPGLPAASRGFSQALLLLGSLAAKRLEELPACPRQQSLARALQLLQQGVPWLQAATQSRLQLSRGQQAELPPEQALQLAERALGELSSLPGGSSGTFSQQLGGLLALLAHPDPQQLSDGELSARVDALVLHCVLLAGCSRGELELELLRRCWALLGLRRSLCCQLRPREGQPGHSLEELCRSMREEVVALDRVALTATLCQILSTFFEDKEPLGQLVEEALSLTNPGALPAGQGGLLKRLQPITATFFRHAQQLLRAADFVLARCTHTRTAREIGEGVEDLRGLLAGLPAALTGISRSVAPGQAAELLRSLCHVWAGARASLLRGMEGAVGTRDFLTLATQEMAKHRERCERALQSQDPQRFSRHATHLASWARWVVEGTTRYVDGATDPLYRNGLLVWVERLASSLLQLKTVTALCLERPSCLQAKDVFSKAAGCLVDAARRVHDGLDGSNHPHILSPLREQVRGTDAAERLELSPKHTELGTPMGEAASQGDLSSGPSSRPRTGDVHPAIWALLAARGAQDVAAVEAAGSALLELSRGCSAAAKAALPLAEAPRLQRVLGQHQEMVLLAPRVIDLAREAPGQLRHPGRLLQTALALSERIRQTQECLAALAGCWYRLAQQVLGFIFSADLLRGKQALEEPMAGLAGAVQLAGAVAGMACSKGNPAPPELCGSLLQVQAQLSRAQRDAEAFLEKAADFKSPCRVGKGSLELRGLQWAVSTRVLLAALDGLVGSDLLLLRELGSSRERQLCSPSLLAAVSEGSLRLQEAAWLSCLCCPEERGRREMLVLREEIKVLMEALLDASSTLSASPPPTASLDVRLELLQRDLALRAKALLLHMEKVNTGPLQVIRDVLGPALAPLSQGDTERSQAAFEEKASRLMANVQWVRTTLQDVLEASTHVNLLSTADHLLVLTSEALASARQLLQSHQGDKGHLHLDTIIWYWSAKANYLLQQLQAVQGISSHVLQLIRQRLQKAEDLCSPRQDSSTAKLLPAPELDALSHSKAAGTCLSRRGQGYGAPREAADMHQNHLPNVSLTSSPAKHERGDSEVWQGGPSKMSQVTKDMATRMLHMTQFLKKKGPILGKQQLVACAEQTASEGQMFARFGRVVAQQCLDSRCSAELLCAAEQTRTISSQLGMVARVKAVTAESRASSELLVSNTLNLTQAVVHLLKAAEAACIKGLQQPPPGSEEEEVAAFCNQWRQSLSWHRAKESLNAARDELGLRKTRARTEPTLTAMVQGQSPQTKNTPQASKTC